MNRYNNTNKYTNQNNRQVLSRITNKPYSQSIDNYQSQDQNRNMGRIPEQKSVQNLEINPNLINHTTAQDMPVIARPSQDRGPEPYVFNITQATMQNRFYRSTLWTGNHLQLTLMSIIPGGEIGLEIHPNVDQFIRIESGRGQVRMGKQRNNLDFMRPVGPNTAIIIPAGTWHNLVNMGRMPIKLYSIYAPPQHPRGTVHRTFEEAHSEERG